MSIDEFLALISKQYITLETIAIYSIKNPEKGELLKCLYIKFLQ